MKKITYYSIYSIIFLLTTACSKEFDLRPETQVAESPSLYKTDAGLETFANGFYNNLDPNVIKDDKYSDNMEHITTPPAMRSSNYTVPTALGSGGWSWSQLRNINYFIQNVNAYTEDQELKRKYLAIARIFRAQFYFQKVKTFGDVPWYSSPLKTSDTEELYKGRDARILVMDSVLSDLDFAIEHLPAEKSKNRMTKWTALALKSRIALFEGTYRKYHTEAKLPNAESWLASSISASKELIDGKVYSLYTTGLADKDYAALFQAASANPNEVILARSSTENFIYYTPEFTSTSNGNFGATFSLLSDYPNLDGRSYFETNNGDIFKKTYYEEFQNRDFRMKQSIVHPGYIRIGTSNIAVNDFAENRTGYQVTKRVGTPMEDQGSDHRDVILIRYSEILLNYAEARAILNKLTQEDLDLTINALRQRAGINNKLILPLKTDANQLSRYKRTQDANVLEICRERRIELAFEGFRKDDLIRWNEGHLFRSDYHGIYIKGYNEYIDLDHDGKFDLYVMRPTDTPPTDKITGVQYFKLSNVNGLSDGNSGRIMPYSLARKPFQSWEYLSPIPLEELTLNNNLKQNEGWNQVK
ncbi:RagB/SusD family nutrient uptake outer membrane protein [Sphingobacterium sp. N143]|uniref:RagB/SusD family nutrient uptake outer membrane protein n=1 Tax=Sphingobacterium sp. N143 TaxID=2746727 RepID=UPI0025763A71|nr:RagB/SusD family nutrient uptake outer membrane protein [Sphingobacterium sp. N143]MDM1296361.1 RagB/SusD family nutrient uptake outer membrane protein [Sphingobacterium sp. N143]